MPSSQAGDGTGQAGGEGVPTVGGQVGILDDQLDRSLVIFDGTILDARRAVLSDPGKPGSEPSEDVDVKHEEEGSGGTAGTGDGAEPTVAATEPGSAGGSQGGEGADQEPSAQGDQAPAAAGGSPGNTPTGTGAMVANAEVPADIPDGQDDDIVARQLRELAMQETDPELREKYWDEYRRYKKGTGK